MPKRIIVLGMLRSGTSLCTSLVQSWGAYAGLEQDLFGDRYGYLEHLGLQKFNDDLMEHNDYLPPLPDVLTEHVQEPDYKQRALNLLTLMDEQAKQQGASAWVWKDARLPLTLPFWVNFWDDPVYVVTIRHPVESVLSAARTEEVAPQDLPLSAGLLYWQYNMLNVLLFTRASRRKIFIAYDQLTDRPRQECARLCRFLDEQCGSGAANADRRIEAMASRVEAAGRHYRCEKALAETPQASREQRALYNFLRVKTLCPDEPFDPDDFALYPGWREYLQAMGMLLAASRKQAA